MKREAKKKSSTFHSCPWDPCNSLARSTTLLWRDRTKRSTVTYSVTGETDNSWNRVQHGGRGQYHFFEDHHEVPKCLKLEAGKQQFALLPKKMCWREKITHGCKNSEIKCHQMSPKMSNFVTIWVFSHSIWVLHDSDSHGFPGASYDIAYSPNLAALGIQNSREVLPILAAKTTSIQHIHNVKSQVLYTRLWPKWHHKYIAYLILAFHHQSKCCKALVTVSYWWHVLSGDIQFV